MLIVHSRDDELVPIAHGRALFELAAEPKSFLEIGGNHNTGFMLSGRSYARGLARFLSALDSGEGAVRAALARPPS